ILYIEPMYAERNSANSIPQLVRVLVSYRPPNQTVPSNGFGATLAEAMDQIFGAGTGSAATTPGVDATPRQGAGVPQVPTQPQGVTPPAAPPPSQARDAAVAELNSSLDNVKNAQRSGNLADLGAAFERLQRAIDAYQAAGK